MKFIILLIALLTISAFASAENALFSFDTYGSKDFVFELTDSKKIQMARDILSGNETERIHVMGKIIKRQQPYNQNYKFYLDPASINFFQVAIEVCDATLLYVEDNLDEACGAFLPGCYYCPWSSKLVKEIKL